jgi:hypothetical protein
MKAYEIHGGICSICPRKIWDLRRKSCIQTYPGGESPEFGHVWTNFPMTSCGKNSADPKSSGKNGKMLWKAVDKLISIVSIFRKFGFDLDGE